MNTTDFRRIEVLLINACKMDQSLEDGILNFDSGGETTSEKSNNDDWVLYIRFETTGLLKEVIKEAIYLYNKDRKARGKPKKEESEEEVNKEKEEKLNIILHP